MPKRELLITIESNHGYDECVVKLRDACRDHFLMVDSILPVNVGVEEERAVAVNRPGGLIVKDEID